MCLHSYSVIIKCNTEGKNKWISMHLQLCYQKIKINNSTIWESYASPLSLSGKCVCKIISTARKTQIVWREGTEFVDSVSRKVMSWMDISYVFFFFVEWHCSRMYQVLEELWWFDSFTIRPLVKFCSALNLLNLQF